MCVVGRHAKLQVFETNIMKFIIDWQNVKIVEVRSAVLAVVGTSLSHSRLLQTSICMRFGLLRSMIPGSARLSVTRPHAASLCKHGWTDRGPAWDEDSRYPRNTVLDGSPDFPTNSM